MAASEGNFAILVVWYLSDRLSFGDRQPLRESYGEEMADASVYVFGTGGFKDTYTAGEQTSELPYQYWYGKELTLRIG